MGSSGGGSSGDNGGGDEFHSRPPVHFLLAAGPATAALVALDRRARTHTAAKAAANGGMHDGPDTDDADVQAVALVLAEVVEHVVRGTKPAAPGPPCRPAEYDVVCPKLPSGCHLNIYDDDGVGEGAAFRAAPGGGYCPAEVLGVGVGDSLVRVNGVCVSTLSFADVCEALGALQHNLVHLRFLRHGTDVELRPNMTVRPRARGMPVFY